MDIKPSYLGLLVYTAMTMYLLAFLAMAANKKKHSYTLYPIGAFVAAIAFVYRWYTTSHIPFQNMFEVFLTMGMLIFPLSVFCKRVLQVGTEGIDMLIGVIILFPAGFIFSADPQKLPPALQSWLFIPHVAVYLLSYIIMAKAAVQASCQIAFKQATVIDYEENTYKMVCFGFPLLTLGLILGSWWGKKAWGDFWSWDPKELWSLASWLIYVCYFHFRYMFAKKHARINSLIALAGMVAILITLLWVNLSKLFAGMHNYAS